MTASLIAADTGILNTQVFYDQLDRLMGASIGVIAIRTREMSRGKLLMHQWASMRGMDFHVWDCLAGFQTYKTLPMADHDDGLQEIAIESDDVDSYLKPTAQISGTDDLLNAMDHYAQRAGKRESDNNMFCGVFMGVVKDWIDVPQVQQHIRDHVQRAYQCNDRMILMLTPGTAIPDAILGDVEVIDLPTPSFSEMLTTFKEMEDQIPETLGFVPSDDDRAVITQNSMGMTQQEFENSFSLAIVDNNARIDNSTTGDIVITAHDFVKVVRERKLEILKQTSILELMPDAKMSEVGGLDLLKAELDLQRDAFLPEARAFGINPPKGFLVVGPPGTGKSLVCKAASWQLGLPAIKFDIAAVFNSLVGSSEQRMRMCLKMLEDMAPCIAFFDEIDKGIGNGGGGGGDSGVSARIFGTLLTWMQDKQDKNIPVLVIASANNVQHIPPELLRKGRFDDIWSVSFPSDVERAAIFKIHVEKRGHSLAEAEYEKLAKRTHTFVGSEIEAVVEGALRIDFRARAKGIRTETLISKIDSLVPQAKAFPERIEAMSKWCEANARPSSSKATFDLVPTGISSPLIRSGNAPIRRLIKPRLN
jgi:SpoVK/Ycf46/Vps4 family AAA+-type ATPase